MIIDKLGNKTYEQSEISYIAQQEIRSKFSPSDEDNIQRKLLGSLIGAYTLTAIEQNEIDFYKVSLKAIQDEAAQAVIDNKVLIDTINYENALKRLEQYDLSIGRPEVTVYKDGTQEVDYVIEAIEPLKAKVDSIIYSEDGVTSSIVKVNNPILVSDKQERDHAKEVIKSASKDVISLFKLRNK